MFLLSDHILKVNFHSVFNCQLQSFSTEVVNCCATTDACSIITSLKTSNLIFERQVLGSVLLGKNALQTRLTNMR